MNNWSEIIGNGTIKSVPKSQAKTKGKDKIWAYVCAVCVLCACVHTCARVSVPEAAVEVKVGVWSVRLRPPAAHPEPLPGGLFAGGGEFSPPPPGVELTGRGL